MEKQGGKMKIRVQVSNRHVHLDEETYNKLFDEELTIKKSISQIGEFAANQVVTIVTDKNKLENVRIIGPFRDYNQIEISKKDAIFLGINPPVKMSGNLDNAEKVILKTIKDEIEVKSCIIAQRHVHVSPEEAMAKNLINGKKVSLIIDGDKSGQMDAYVKYTKDACFEAHIDTDDAAAFLLNNNQEVELIK